MTGKSLGDVLLVSTPAVEMAPDDEYGVRLGSEILGDIIGSTGPSPRPEVYKDDAWAVVDFGEGSSVNVSIVWVTEEEGLYWWALQFQLRRGCLGLFTRESVLSPKEALVRQSVEAAARKTACVSHVRWLTDAEFREIY